VAADIQGAGYFLVGCSGCDLAEDVDFSLGEVLSVAAALGSLACRGDRVQ
jgi:hypothetical protein